MGPDPRGNVKVSTSHFFRSSSTLNPSLVPSCWPPSSNRAGVVKRWTQFPASLAETDVRLSRCGGGVVSSPARGHDVGGFHGGASTAGLYDAPDCIFKVGITLCLPDATLTRMCPVANAHWLRRLTSSLRLPPPGLPHPLYPQHSFQSDLAAAARPHQSKSEPASAWWMPLLPPLPIITLPTIPLPQARPPQATRSLSRPPLLVLPFPRDGFVLATRLTRPPRLLQRRFIGKNAGTLATSPPPLHVTTLLWGLLHSLRPTFPRAVNGLARRTQARSAGRRTFPTSPRLVYGTCPFFQAFTPC